jgi:GT2 family glycosyltransferase
LAVVNNDVVFYPGWFSAMMSYHENNPLVKSFSPIDPLYEEQLRKNYPGEKGLEGYEIRKHIKGWCIVSHKELVKTCELFDETFSFWYQDDDDYIETIKRKKYKHALILDSFVHHFGSKSTELFKENTQQKTWDQAHVFNSKWGQL